MIIFPRVHPEIGGRDLPAYALTLEFVLQVTAFLAGC
jgi:hypothetical protein